MLKTLLKSTQTLASTAQATQGASVSLSKAKTFSAQCNVTVDTPSAKVFASTAVDTAADTITITAHGLPTGLVGQLTTSGALPTGLSLATNYYVIVVDADTIKLADSLAHAQAGTAVNITGQGSGNDTFTPTALATGTVQLQKSNDGSNWAAEGSTVSVTATGTYWLEKIDPTALYMRVAYSLASGSFSSSTIILTQGEE